MLSPGRVIALVIAAAYVCVPGFTGDGEGALSMTMFVVVPLACIFFPDAMGDYTGFLGGDGHISRTTPGPVVYIAGWGFLLSPVLIAVIAAMVD